MSARMLSSRHSSDSMIVETLSGSWHGSYGSFAIVRSTFETTGACAPQSRWSTHRVCTLIQTRDAMQSLLSYASCWSRRFVMYRTRNERWSYYMISKGGSIAKSPDG